MRAATRGHLERGWWKNTHSARLLESAPIAYIRSFLSVTEAAKMTIKKSKTVVFERRAGDLTALYCMNDWVVAVVLAIIVMMSVWAALIIYRYIQTERGKRRRKVDDDTILETEKDENETTNEEKILSCVESTGKSTFISVHSSLIGPRIVMKSNVTHMQHSCCLRLLCFVLYERSAMIMNRKPTTVMSTNTCAQVSLKLSAVSAQEVENINSYINETLCLSEKQISVVCNKIP